jgi:hypothetical protein
MSKPATLRAPPSFGALVQSFFTEYLTQQRAMSPRTVATYRDGFVMFQDYATTHLRKQPTTTKLQDITQALILAFLDHLEQDRGNAVRTRNARLAALRAFLKFAGHRDVNALHVVEQALGVPMKRFERPMLGFQSREEMQPIDGIALWLGHGEPNHHASVHGGQPADEGEGPGSDARPRHRQPALPCPGLAARGPEGLVIMRSARAPSATCLRGDPGARLPRSCHNRGLLIMADWRRGECRLGMRLAERCRPLDASIAHHGASEAK